jgi:hypothetical protein
MTTPGLTALLDQVDAAARQVHAGLRAQAAASGQPLRNVAGDPWARQVVDDVHAAELEGRLYGCQHLAAPRPVITAAWRRDLVTCPPCAKAAFDLRGDPVADGTCDRCGRYSRGHIFPGLFAAGVLLVLVGLCGDCNALTAATAP